LSTSETTCTGCLQMTGGQGLVRTRCITRFQSSVGSTAKTLRRRNRCSSLATLTTAPRIGPMLAECTTLPISLDSSGLLRGYCTKSTGPNIVAENAKRRSATRTWVGNGAFPCKNGKTIWEMNQVTLRSSPCLSTLCVVLSTSIAPSHCTDYMASMHVSVAGFHLANSDRSHQVSPPTLLIYPSPFLSRHTTTQLSFPPFPRRNYEQNS